MYILRTESSANKSGGYAYTRHELNGDAADDSTTNKGPEVADEDVI
ncbi:unnamed protein product, partial [Ascophyllum nodosum]